MAELKPCPFCGGEAFVEEFTSGIYMQRMKIVCNGCGVVLDWTQEYICSEAKKYNKFGEKIPKVRIPTNIDAIQAWNRRANEKGGSDNVCSKS